MPGHRQPARMRCRDRETGACPDDGSDALPGDTVTSDASDALPSDASDALPCSGDGSDGLPSDAGSDTTPRKCCRNHCQRLLESPGVREQLAQWEQHKSKVLMDRDRMNSYAFRLLQAMQQTLSNPYGKSPVSDSSPNASSASAQHYMFLGVRVCRTAFRRQLGMGNSRLGRLLRWLAEGHLEPPMDLRHSQAEREKPASAAADQWFQWAYETMAETFSESTVRDCSELDVLLPWLAKTPVSGSQPVKADDGLREWILGAGATSAALASSEDVRWLPPSSMVELYEQMQEYRADHDDHDNRRCSYVTFLRVYQTKWAKTLRIRPQGMHAKCPDCERFKDCWVN